MRNLLWKEWHEQSWKLGFACIVLGALALIGMRSRILADQTMAMWVCCLGIMLLPLLSSTGLVPAERSEGTLESLLVLPVSARKILVAKTVMGIALCVLPMIVAALASVLVTGNREYPASAMLGMYGRFTVASLYLFIWMLALTIHLPSETRAGALAMGMVIFWGLATAGFAEPSTPRSLAAISPLAPVYVYGSAFERCPPLVVMVLVPAVIAVILWNWACKRLTNLEGRP